MNLTYLVLHREDPLLGRIDLHSLPQEALMDLLIDGFESKGKIRGYREEANPIDLWPCVTLNDQREVTAIDWSWRKIEGTINIRWLPLTLVEFCLSVNQLGGSVDLSSLPQFIRTLELKSNNFTGEIDLRYLPETMELFTVYDNQLVGALNLLLLPQSLFHLDLGSNVFSGLVNLSRLPPLLTFLSLGKNKLTGSIDVTQLPGKLKKLNLGMNMFSGSTDFSKLPDSLEYFNVSHTSISGEILQKKGQIFIARNTDVRIHDSV